jgi:hypothetical protein
MSKGIGARQRMLLAAIQQHGCLSTFEACLLAYGVEICEESPGASAVGPPSQQDQFPTHCASCTAFRHPTWGVPSVAGLARAEFA